MANEHPESTTIRNRTARRIEVARHDQALSGLIIPPFGARTLPATDVCLYDFAPWKAQRLVDEDARPATVDKGSRFKAVCAQASGYCFLASMVFVVVGGVDHRRAWLGAVATALALTAAFAWATHWDSEAWGSMARSFNIFLGLLIAFGATGGAIFLNHPDPFGHASDAPDVVLALIILWLFMAMASVLPAALFLFFHRQKVPTLRANFLRDVVRLDPNVQTVDDAENHYDVLIRDVYGSGDGTYSPGRRLPMLAATGVIAGLWIWTLVPGLSTARSTRDLLLPQPDIVTFAFLGAYVFAVNMLFRRYARADLGPKVYTHVIVRIFAAISTVWVLSFAPFARSADGRPRALMLLLAFFVGIVPETGTAIVQDLLQQWKPVARVIPSLGEDHPISRIEGISLYDRAQLLEVGIENIESLAHHNIVELMLWTRIPTARLVDFVDQAILYMHVRGPVAADAEGTVDPAGARNRLVRHGIRTATDLERAYAMAASRSTEEADDLLGLVDCPGLPVRRLRVIMDAMEDDEWMVYVRNWRDQTSVGQPVPSVEEFVVLAARGTGPIRSSTPPSLVDGVELVAAPPAPPVPSGNGAVTPASPTGPQDRRSVRE